MPEHPDDTHNRNAQVALFLEIHHWVNQHQKSPTRKNLVSSESRALADTAEALFGSVKAAWDAYMHWEIDIRIQRSTELRWKRENNRRIRTQHLRDYDVFLDALQVWHAQHGSPIERKRLIATGDRLLADAAVAHHNGLAVAAGAIAHREQESWKRWSNAELVILRWIAQHGHFPAREELDATGFGVLRIAIEKYLGGWTHVRTLLGYTPVTTDTLEDVMPAIVKRYLATVPRVPFPIHLEALLREFPTETELRTFLAAAPHATPRSL